MGESRTDVAFNVFEISGPAWALTVHKAAEALAHEPDMDLSAYQDSIQARAVRQLDAGAIETAAAELRRTGISDTGGAITRQWVLAVGIAAFGPVKVNAVVQSAGLSVHTDLALAGGKGIGVTYARRIRQGDKGAAVTEVRNTVEISFFAEEDAWAAISRHLPDPAQVPEPSEQLKPPASTQNETVANASHTIHLGVSAHPAGPRSERAHPAAPGAPGHASWDVWALADRLYSVGTRPSGDGSGLNPVPSDAIGREFAWRLLGAREYLASVAEQAA